MTTYPVVSHIPVEDLIAIGVCRRNVQLFSKGGRLVRIRATKTGEFRAPKRGEWYLSGAILEAYRARHDMVDPYHIVELVGCRHVKTWEVVA